MSEHIAALLELVENETFLTTELEQEFIKLDAETWSVIEQSGVSMPPVLEPAAAFKNAMGGISFEVEREKAKLMRYEVVDPQYLGYTQLPFYQHGKSKTRRIRSDDWASRLRSIAAMMEASEQKSEQSKKEEKKSSPRNWGPDAETLFREIKKDLLKGTKEGRAIEDGCERLNERGIKTKLGRKFSFKSMKVVFRGHRKVWKERLKSERKVNKK